MVDRGQSIKTPPKQSIKTTIVLLASIATFAIGGIKAVMGCATSGHGGLTASSGKGKMDRPERRVLRMKDNGWTKDKTKKESAAMNTLRERRNTRRGARP